MTYRRRILVIGDGKTEENYFDGLTCTNPDLLIRSYGAGKTGLGHILKKARKHMDDLGIDIANGDRVVLVMDLDLIYSVADVERMEAECAKRGIELYVSNPASRYGCCSISVVSTGPAIRRTLSGSCRRISEGNMSNPSCWSGMGRRCGAQWPMRNRYTETASPIPIVPRGIPAPLCTGW